MIRLLLVVTVLVGCAERTGEILTTSTSEETAFRFDFDPDQWTGEVEWDLVEECSLLGIAQCATRVEDMRAGECSVESTRQLFSSLASASPREHNGFVEKIISRGDCAMLNIESWQLRRP